MKITKGVMLLSIISVVFLSGCTKGGEAPSGAGIIITSFAPDIQEVDAGSSVTFIVNMKNTGGVTSGDGKALFFGLSNDWTDVTDAVKTVPSLAPADPSLGLPGEETSLDWSSTIKASAAKNADVTYDASVRVMYGYTTTTDTLLRFVTTDYVRTNPDVLKGIQSSTTSVGPFLVTATARTPTLSLTSTKGRVQFEIQNIGPGRVIKTIPDTGLVSASDLDIIKKITITGIGSGPVGECAGKAASADGIVVLDNIRLAGGKSKVISCDVSVAGITNFKDIALNVKIEYNYYVDSATSITVRKSLEGEGVAPDTTAPVRYSPTANGNPATVSSPASLPANTTSVVLGISTNEVATCKYNTTATQTTYDTLGATFSLTGSTSHSSTLSPLTAGTYSYNVLCKDSNGNNNTDASYIKFTIAS